jgi:hypothetical protein
MEQNQNKTPRSSRVNIDVTPKTGGGDRNKTPESVPKAAPSDRPAVRKGNVPRKVGSELTPTSVKSNIVANPVQPPKRGK